MLGGYQMELTPEERRKIYEEEKARIEARERLEKERQAPGTESTVNLEPKVAGLLCYVGWWISGLIFFIIEQKNDWIRFHAAQSLITFGSIVVFGSLVAPIPWVGLPLAIVTWFIGFVLWIVLMVKAYNGERFKLGIFGDFAEKLVASTGTAAPPSADTTGTRTHEDISPAPAEINEPPPTGSAVPVEAVATHRASDSDGLEERIDRKIREYFHKKQTGHIIGSAFAIAWSIIVLVFLNFFHEYVAYYTSETVNGHQVWVNHSVFTADISQWLPLLTTTMVLSIIGHIIIIAFYRPLLRKITLFILDIFSLATVVALLVIYPFNFNVIPNELAASITGVVVTAVLIATSIGFTISLIVRLIQMLVALTRGEINLD